MPNIAEITDEEELHKMMNKTEDFDERKKIRARLREIRDKEREEMEARRKQRQAESTDAVKMKFQMQEEQKKKQLEGFAKQAQKNTATTSSTTETSQTLPGGGTRTVITKKTATTVQSSGPAGPAKTAEQTARELTEQLMKSSSPGGHSGHITVKTESWNSSDGVVNRSQNTQSWGGGGRGGGRGGTGPANPMAAFKQMDNTANGGAAKPKMMARSPSAIKQVLLDWTKAMTKGYPNVEITNFSNSWNTGMAFCALIHHFYPDAFDYSALNPKARRYNFTLAFDTAEQKGDIAPLLDVDDMVKMKNPDWKCVFTYVQSLYRHLRDHENNKAMPCPVAPVEQ